MSEKMDGTAACKNTDRHLWPQVSDESDCPKLFVTEGDGIGIDVGGHVIVKPLREWHKLARASSPAQEPVTTEPVAWRYQRKEWDALLWRYQTEALVNDDFETPGDWLIEPLYAIHAPPQPGREEIAGHLYTKFCADPSIEWQDAPEKLKEVWRRYAGEIAALSGEEGK